MSVAAASLFDRPPRPVLGTASDWTQAALGGSVATSLCIVAIAILGLLLLTGRLQFRRSAEVAIGCFLLLGAGLLTNQLRQLVEDVAGWGHIGYAQIIAAEPIASEPLPPAKFDPYAGASLRRD